jgi:hypothetical protein
MHMRAQYNHCIMHASRMCMRIMHASIIILRVRVELFLGFLDEELSPRSRSSFIEGSASITQSIKSDGRMKKQFPCPLPY